MCGADVSVDAFLHHVFSNKLSRSRGSVNHFDLRDSQEGIETIRQAFRQSDIDLPEVAEDPPEDDPPELVTPPDDPPECEDPNVIIC